MINPLGTNPLDRLAQIKEQADLKSQISKLSTELQSASTQDAKAKIGAQLQALAAQSGQSLQSFGVDTGSIFNPKMALIATPAGGTGGLSQSNAVPGRSDADAARDKAVIKDLNNEFGISASGDQKDIWAQKSIQDDKITIYGKDGQVKNGEINKGDIIEVKSDKYGIVKIQAGGDGAINGRDDKILSIGTQVAATGVQNGLNNINAKPAAVNPAQAPQVQQAQQLGKLQMAQNPQLAGLVDQAQNPYQLSDTEIKNLLAAIMQLVNQSSK